MIIPVQFPSSVALPEQGILPPVKVRVLFLFASVSHVPEHDPHGSHVDHKPSTSIATEMEETFSTNYESIGCTCAVSLFRFISRARFITSREVSCSVPFCITVTNANASAPLIPCRPHAFNLT